MGTTSATALTFKGITKVRPIVTATTITTPETTCTAVQTPTLGHGVTHTLSSAARGEIALHADVVSAIPLDTGFVNMAQVAEMTTQIPDLLLFKGKRYTIDHTPLEMAWREGDVTKPKFDFRITFNWRGYVATWRIEEEDESTDGTHLLLRNLAGGTVDGEPISHMAALGYDESECDGTEEVIADWFSGAINAGRGKLIYSEPTRTTRVLHSEMLHLQVHRGKVLSLREAQYTEADVERFFPVRPPVDENQLPHFLRKIPPENWQTEDEGICIVSRRRFPSPGTETPSTDEAKTYTDIVKDMQPRAGTPVPQKQLHTFLQKHPASETPTLPPRLLDRVGGGYGAFVIAAFLCVPLVYWYGTGQRESRQRDEELQLTRECVEERQAKTTKHLNQCLTDKAGAREAMDEYANRGKEHDYEGRASARGR